GIRLIAPGKGSENNPSAEPRSKHGLNRRCDSAGDSTSRKFDVAATFHPVVGASRHVCSNAPVIHRMHSTIFMTAAWNPSIAVLVVFISLAASGRAEFPTFQEVVIDAEACERAVYAVTLADVDGDGRDDIVAVTENAVVWSQNPIWKKRVIIENQTELDNVCI